MGPFPGVSCQHVYATQSANPKNSSVKYVLSDLEDNNCIDGRGQVTLSSRSLYQIRETSRSLCQIRETCATRFRSILCDVTITIELMDGDRSQHHPDHFIKLEYTVPTQKTSNLIIKLRTICKMSGTLFDWWSDLVSDKYLSWRIYIHMAVNTSLKEFPDQIFALVSFDLRIRSLKYF